VIFIYFNGFALEYVLESIADYPANKIHELLPNNIDKAKIENFKKFYEV